MASQHALDWPTPLVGATIRFPYPRASVIRGWLCPMVEQIWPLV